MSRKSKRQLSMDERWAAWHLRQANEVPELQSEIKRVRRQLSKLCSMSRYPKAKTFPDGEPEAGYLEYRDLVYYRGLLTEQERNERRAGYLEEVGEDDPTLPAPDGCIPEGNIQIGHRTVHSTMVTIQWIDAQLRNLVIEASPDQIEFLNKRLSALEAQLNNLRKY